MAAVALPRTLLSLTTVIDNPWSVCSTRAAEVKLIELFWGGLQLGFVRQPQDVESELQITRCAVDYSFSLFYYFLRCAKSKAQRSSTAKNMSTFIDRCH